MQAAYRDIFCKTNGHEDKRKMLAPELLFAKATAALSQESGCTYAYAVDRLTGT